MILSTLNLNSRGEANTFNCPAFYFLFYYPKRETSKTAYFYKVKLLRSNLAFPTKSSNIKSLSITENYNDLFANNPTFQKILYLPIPNYAIKEFLLLAKSLIST